MRRPDEAARANPDVTFFDDLVDCLAAHYPIDRKRIYIGGLSAGGIMTNRVLRERSDVLAGGIVGSGVFELTEPVPAKTLAPMFVIVTWGGDNDAWGGTNAGVTVPEINFAEQGALASDYYESSPGLNQVYCEGHNLGHGWLDQINDWMYDALLAHPKGAANHAGWTFSAPSASDVTCSEDGATTEGGAQVTCGGTGGCHDYCQMVGDCVAENTTVSPILGPQLMALGFSGDDCGGCITACEEDLASGGTADETVLTCFSDQAATAACGPGITGALPFTTAANECCEGATTSEVCTRLCTSIATNTSVLDFVPSCRAWL
jgi:hypothetical protein